MMKHILILAGASGVGKTSLAMRLLEVDPRFSFVRSATTRPPRGDGHDDEYVYLSEAGFKNAIASHAMLEYMQYGDNYYGTPTSEIERIFSEGKIPLLVLDIVGVKSCRSLELDYSVFAFYIYDELDEVEKRLYKRELSDSPTVDKLLGFQKRKDANVRDYLTLEQIADDFDAFIRNSDFDTALSDIRASHSSLSEGQSPRREENHRVAASLAESAAKKK